MIRYINSTESVAVDNLGGFFVGWPNPPSAQTHLDLLNQSDQIILAIDEDSGNVVGFITAITDNLLSAYIPLLEVLPAYQGQGIGKKLVKIMLKKLSGLYMVDLLCDQDLKSFYSPIGMRPGFGMMKRNYDCQSGTKSKS